jgi:hypothetical protein
MRITQINDIVVPIRSEIRNAYISFAEMTASAVAIHTGIVRDGKPLTGYGFNSNGRYSQSGIMRDRMIPDCSLPIPDYCSTRTASSIPPKPGPS